MPEVLAPRIHHRVQCDLLIQLNKSQEIGSHIASWRLCGPWISSLPLLYAISLNFLNLYQGLGLFYWRTANLHNIFPIKHWWKNSVHQLDLHNESQYPLIEGIDLQKEEKGCPEKIADNTMSRIYWGKEDFWQNLLCGLGNFYLRSD